MQLLLLTTSLSIQMIPRSVNSKLVLRALYNQIGHVSPHYDRMTKFPNQNLELLYSREQCDFPGLGPVAWISKGTKGVRNLVPFLPL